MEVITVEVDVDHVHVYIQIPPQHSVGEAVRVLKSISAREMFRLFPYFKRKLWGGEMWNDGYFARTVGEGVTAAMIKQYIEHHANKDALEPVQATLFPEDKGGKRPKRGT